LQQHRFSYDEPMPVESCTQALCDVALSFGEDDEKEGSMVRFAWPTFNTFVYSTVWISKTLIDGLECRAGLLVWRSCLLDGIVTVLLCE